MLIACLFGSRAKRTVNVFEKKDQETCAEIFPLMPMVTSMIATKKGYADLKYEILFSNIYISHTYSTNNIDGDFLAKFSLLGNYMALGS